MSILTRKETHARFKYHARKDLPSPLMIVNDNGYFSVIFADTVRAHILAGTLSNNCKAYFARKVSGYNLRKQSLPERSVCIVYKPLSADEVDALAEKHNLKFKGE